MCRNIRTLYNFTPAASDEEIHAARSGSRSAQSQSAGQAQIRLIKMILLWKNYSDREDFLKAKPLWAKQLK